MTTTTQKTATYLTLVLAFDHALDCAAVEQELDGYRSLVEWSRGRAQLVTLTDGEE